MSKVVRIGSTGGFLGDTAAAAPQLVAGGELDYLVLDYLAEMTMSFLAKAKAKDPDGGYAHDFTDWVWKDNVREIARRGIKLVTNAGGINVRGCRARMEQLAAEAGVSLKIAVVEGDDIRDQIPGLAAEGLAEMYSGEAFPAPERIASANAYLGGRPIAEALARGADVVITGRVVDSALVLGPLMHEFGWADTDYDMMSAGSLAGHLLECGAQATGGLFTDWREVEDWAHIGYPVAECHADGSFVMTKPAGTGGLVSVGTISEQTLYEIGDPQAYLLPDVACDWTGVRIEQQGEDRVRVSGARGRPPTATFKVCATFEDGYRCVGVLPIVGMDAAAKAERQAAALIERTEEMLRARNMGPYRAVNIESLGAESTYGAHSRARGAREVISKISVEHEDKHALALFAREITAPMTSMMVGNTGWHGGRPPISKVVRLFSFPLAKDRVRVTVDVGGDTRPVPITTAGGFDPSSIVRPQVEDAPPLAADAVRVRLVEIAWGRSGDKGDKFNVGIVARRPEFLPYIRAALTEETVRDWFVHEFAGAAHPRVERFDLPGMHAVNFLCHEALGGGGMATLRLDQLAKGKAQQLLEIEVPIPAALAKDIRLAA
ncbi:MAG: acyclic terpene utilization AtuA family protein [Alphaproteobacteria bacterium]|nr:acyclic terpene utilization AtuA family protein [Alphaproteobacteria bacterium]